MNLVGGRRGLAVGVGLLATGLGLGAARLARPAPAAPLPVLDRVPGFSLIDARGELVTQETLVGSVWVAGFFFSRCAGQCPLLAERMAHVEAHVRGRPDFRLVSFTVDPAHDRPPVLASYAARLGARPGRWLFLTEPDAAPGVPRGSIQSLARSGFHLAASDGGPPEEPIAHSSRLVLVDQEGVIRGYYDLDEPGALARLMQDAARLLDGSRS